MSLPTLLQPIADLFQDRVLARKFLDGLLPKFQFDAVAPDARKWQAHAGLNLVVTSDGYYEVTPVPSSTSVDPQVSQRQQEQWQITLQQYDGMDNINATAAANMLADYAKQTANRIAIQAAQTLDAAARAVYTSAAEAGWTVVDGVQNSTTIQVMRLNGFTQNIPPGGILHQNVSASNPLDIMIGGVANQVIGFQADQVLALQPGVSIDDIMGPGRLLLATAANVADRDPVIASNASFVQRSGAGSNRTTGKIDDVTGPISYLDIRKVKAQFSQSSALPMTRYNGLYMCQLSPTAWAQLQGDPDFQRLQQGRGVEDFPYATGTIGSYAGIFFLENNHALTPQTVYWRTASGRANLTPTVYGRMLRHGFANASTDPVGVETVAARSAARPIDHSLFFADDCAAQYYQPHPLQMGAGMLSEVGIGGIAAEPYQVIADNVMVNVAYTTMLFRAPINTKMDQFPVTWLSNRSWTPRLDQIAPAGGAPAKIRRMAAIQSDATV